MFEIIVEIFESVSIIFDFIGALIVLWSGVLAVKRMWIKEFLLGSQKHHLKMNQLEIIRKEFGNKIVLGIEFFLAGDMIKTVVAPSFDAVIQLGALIIIRTILSISLSYELKK